MKFGLVIIGAIVGFGIGVIEENLRYSIIYHEAMKGDARSKEIIDQFDLVGQWIENGFKR